MNRRAIVGVAIASAFFASLLATVSSAARADAQAPFATLERASTPAGYLARLLINETPFPGERAFVSETNTKEAMFEILCVLHSRIHLIPDGYTQQQVAGVRSKDIIDVITGTGGRRPCTGFYRDASGKFVTESRVEERVANLLRIANGGGRPGRFASLLNYAQELARSYVEDGIEPADRFGGLKRVGEVEVTGHAYSWMKDGEDHEPGGNFVTIPTSQDGALGGNRFFTLRKSPK